MKSKKSVIGPIISVFVMILVVSILAGLSFLFVAQLKTNAQDTTTKTIETVNNETGFINSSGYTLETATALAFADPTITVIINATDNDWTELDSGNYTLSSTGVLTNATDDSIWDSVNITYTYSHIADKDRNAYVSINSTEEAGATVINYLSLIFLAVIFGAILTLVLKIILPYINLGKNMDGF